MFRDLQYFCTKQAFFRNFKNADGLMSTLTATLVSALETRTPEEWILVRSAFRRSAGARSNSAKGGNVNAHLVEYAAFCQAAHLVTLLLRFKSAGGLFQQGRAASGCLRSMIGFAVTGQHLPPQHQQALRGPSRLVAECLLDLLSSSSHARSVLASSPHLTVQLMTPLRLWMETKGARSKNLGQMHLHACQILTCLLNNTSGGVGGGPALREKDDNLEILMDFCCRALDRHQDLEHATKMTVASLAECVLTSTTISVAGQNFERYEYRV